MDLIPGYKTYIVVAAMVAYAVGGLILGHTDANVALHTILEAAGLLGLRLAIGRQ